MRGIILLLQIFGSKPYALKSCCLEKMLFLCVFLHCQEWFNDQILRLTPRWKTHSHLLSQSYVLPLLSRVRNPKRPTKQMQIGFPFVSLSLTINRSRFHVAASWAVMCVSVLCAVPVQMVKAQPPHLSSMSATRGLLMSVPLVGCMLGEPEWQSTSPICDPLTHGIRSSIISSSAADSR